MKPCITGGEEMKNKRRLIGWVCLMCLCLAAPAGAQNPFAVPGTGIVDDFTHRLVFSENFNSQDAARLSRWLLVGSQGRWNGRLGPGMYSLHNIGGPNEANYFFLNAVGGTGDGWIAEVQIRSDLRRGTDYSGAGLAYAPDASTDLFFAFILQGGGRYAFLKKDQTGFQLLQSGANAPMQPYVFNCLSVGQRSPAAVDLFVNGRLVATVNAPDVGRQGGPIGLIAVSTGEFAFGSLRVAVPAAADPPSAGWVQTAPAAPPPAKEDAQQTPGDVQLTAADLAMARQVIEDNTMTIPGFGTGSSIKMGPGALSAVDALVIYMLKFHLQHRICPPISVVAAALEKINDSRYAKKAAALFWKDYSTAAGASSLEQSFEWYINTKATEKNKIANLRLQGYVGADEAWQKAMHSQRSTWEKSTQRRDAYILKRDAYRVILDAQAAVAAAEQALR